MTNFSRGHLLRISEHKRGRTLIDLLDELIGFLGTLEEFAKNVLIYPTLEGIITQLFHQGIVGDSVTEFVMLLSLIVDLNPGNVLPA
jgi:hypothetical protein